MVNKTFWTPENRRRLDAMVRKGALRVTLHKAAEILGTSVSTLAVELRRRGVRTAARHTFEWTAARKRMLRAMLDAKGNFILPRAVAASIIGCDRSTLTTGVIALRGDAPTRVDPRRLKRFTTKDGRLTLPRRDVAQKLGCSMKALHNAMRKLQLRGPAQFAWTPDKISKLQKSLRSRGTGAVTQKVAARKIGCSVRTLQSKVTVLKATRLAVSAPLTTAEATSSVLHTLRRWLPHPAPRRVSEAVKAHPVLASMGPERIGHRLRALAAIYRVPETAALQMALSAPELFVADLSLLRRNLRDAAQVFAFSAKAYASFLRRKPALALIDGPLMQDRMARLSLLLQAAPDKTLSLARQYPGILLIPSLELSARARALTSTLDLTPNTLATVLRRQPNILLYKSDVLGKHCRATARLTGLSLPAVTKAFIQNPSILQVKPDTLAGNISEAARLLGCTKKHVAASFLAKPSLLTMRPDFISQKIDILAGILLLSREQMVRRALAYPYLLSFAADNIAEKAGMLIKLSEAVGKPATIVQILDMMPMAFSYSKERIAERVELARAGLGWKSVGTRA